MASYHNKHMYNDQRNFCPDVILLNNIYIIIHLRFDFNTLHIVGQHFLKF